MKQSQTNPSSSTFKVAGQAFVFATGLAALSHTFVPDIHIFNSKSQTFQQPEKQQNVGDGLLIHIGKQRIAPFNTEPEESSSINGIYDIDEIDFLPAPTASYVVDLEITSVNRVVPKVFIDEIYFEV